MARLGFGCQHVPDLPEEGVGRIVVVAVVSLALARKGIRQVLLLLATLSSLTENALGSMGKITLYSLPEFCLWAISSARPMVLACIETLKRAVPLPTSTEILLILILLLLLAERTPQILSSSRSRAAG